MARIYSKWVLKCLCAIIVVGYQFVPIATAQIENFPKFSNYKLIQPRFYHGREKREILTTKQEDGNHAEHLIMTYNDEDKNYIVDLELNKHLITDGYSMKYQENGKYVFRNNSIQNMELCYYQGKIRNLPDSWAALSTCSEDGLGGIIYNGYENHYFEKAFNEKGEYLRSFNVVYKHSDLIGTKKIKFSKEQTRKRKYKRSYQESRLGKKPYNYSNRRSRYIELLVVVDHEWFLAQDRKLVFVELNVLNMVNTLNALYTPLNIHISLTEILVWTERNEFEYTNNLYDSLLKFLRYREEQLIVQYPNDFSVLVMFDQRDANLELHAFTLPEKMCSSTSSGCVVIGNNIFVTAVRMARRIGLSLGIRYDEEHCVCPEENCIMNRHDFDLATHWSSCNFEDLVNSYERDIDYCLRNKPDETKYNDPTCGNGFVDSGDQCDCGLPSHCNNSCCNAATCTFYSNATCATGECCDLNNCKLKVAGTVCRLADNECDLPEYCTGKSEHCPADVFKMDTLPCVGGKSYCYRGSCRTRSDQCKQLWGETGKPSSNECYSLNTQGSLRGSCGYNKLNKRYSKCSSENILCGMVHCRSSDENLKIGPLFGPYALCRFINTENGSEQCCTAKLDFGYNEIDPGMVPDGSTCGESKMCVNQTCVELADLRTATCANNCSGNGICNNLGHCHCDVGFAPPLCENHGYGGSEDSGPTIDPSSAMMSNFIFQVEKQWNEATKVIASNAVP